MTMFNNKAQFKIDIRFRSSFAGKCFYGKCIMHRDQNSYVEAFPHHLFFLSKKKFYNETELNIAL